MSDDEGLATTVRLLFAPCPRCGVTPSDETTSDHSDHCRGCCALLTEREETRAALARWHDDHGPDGCPCTACAWLAAYLADEPAARAMLVDERDRLRVALATIAGGWHDGGDQNTRGRTPACVADCAACVAAAALAESAGGR